MMGEYLLCKSIGGACSQCILVSHFVSAVKILNDCLSLFKFLKCLSIQEVMMAKRKLQEPTIVLHWSIGDLKLKLTFLYGFNEPWFSVFSITFDSFGNVGFGLIYDDIFDSWRATSNNSRIWKAWIARNLLHTWEGKRLDNRLLTGIWDWLPMVNNCIFSHLRFQEK